MNEFLKDESTREVLVFDFIKKWNEFVKDESTREVLGFDFIKKWILSCVSRRALGGPTMDLLL